jgi:hypothetical protein
MTEKPFSETKEGRKLLKDYYTSEELMDLSFKAGQKQQIGEAQQEYVIRERLKARQDALEEVEKIIKEIQNSYPSDLVKKPEKPETQEGKFWMFGQKVWENFRISVLEELEALKKETRK